MSIDRVEPAPLPDIHEQTAGKPAIGEAVNTSNQVEERALDLFEVEKITSHAKCIDGSAGRLLYQVKSYGYLDKAW